MYLKKAGAVLGIILVIAWIISGALTVLFMATGIFLGQSLSGLLRLNSDWDGNLTVNVPLVTEAAKMGALGLGVSLLLLVLVASLVRRLDWSIRRDVMARAELVISLVLATSFATLVLAVSLILVVQAFELIPLSTRRALPHSAVMTLLVSTALLLLIAFIGGPTRDLSQEEVANPLGISSEAQK